MTTNIFDVLAGIPDFGGKPEELSNFLEHVDEVRKFADAALITLFDLRVRHKIIGRANIALINSNNPSKWDDMKIILKTNFTINESIESIINKIKAAECKTSISNFYDYLLDLLTKLNLKNSIDKDEWYSCEKNEKMVLKIFTSKLPSEPKLILNARNPNSLLKAREILTETDYFYKNFYNNKKSNLQSISSNENFNNSLKRNERFQNNNGNRGQNSGSSQSRNFYESGNRFNGNRNFNESGNRFNGNRNLNESGNRFNGNRNFINTSGNFARNQYNSNSGQVNVDRNQVGGSTQRTNLSRQVPMEVDTVQTSNFQLVPEELFPA